MWKIGKIEIKNPVALAPMAGVSNPAYIKICAEMGAGYAVTELISAEAIVRGNQKTFDMLNGIEDLPIPVAIQLFGSNPQTIAKAAKILVEKYPVPVIDINMGCPVPKVAQRANSGSALLKDPEKIYEIVKAVKESVEIPVTVKIRSGWDQEHRNAVLVAKKIEEAGADAICIHPRTRSQGYSGKADWQVIKEVKQAVKIPVIGNGDILTCFDAKRMMEETGCDAIMIGRGVLGNPWLIRECVMYLEKGEILDPPTYEERVNMIYTHFEYLCKQKPEKVALLEIRTHAAWYLKGMPGGKEIKMQIFSVKTKEEFLEILKEYEKSLSKMLENEKKD